MKAGRQDIREQREVPDLLHCLCLVREPQKIPVSIGNHQIVGLTALPPAEVEAVGAAVDLIVDVHANVGVPLLAVAAASAGDVEWDRTKIALLDECDVRPNLDDLAGHLMPEYHPFRRGEPAVVDMLVATADIRRHDLEDGAVIGFLSVRRDELGIVECLKLDLHRLYEGDDPVALPWRTLLADWHAVDKAYERPRFGALMGVNSRRVCDRTGFRLLRANCLRPSARAREKPRRARELSMASRLACLKRTGTSATWVSDLRLIPRSSILEAGKRSCRTWPRSRSQRP